MKRRCLRALQAGLEVSGLAALYVRLGKVTGTTILNFHSVADRREAPWVDPRQHVEPVVFERQMRFIATKRHPVSLSRLVESLEAGKDLPPRSVVITFDDAYLDHLTVAAPILVKHGIPATFFAPTGYVSRGRNQWVDQLYSSFRTRTRQVLIVEDEDSLRFDLSHPSQEEAAYRRLEDLLLDATYVERETWLRNLDYQLRPEGRAPRLTMDWDDVRSLERFSPDFEIGGHSRDHIDLSTRDVGTAGREVLACAEDLRRELGTGPRHFAYPYDRWTPAVKEEVRRQGFRSGLTAGQDCRITLRSDRFALQRIDAAERRYTLGFVTSGAYPDLSKALTGRA